MDTFIFFLPFGLFFLVVATVTIVVAVRVTEPRYAIVKAARRGLKMDERAARAARQLAQDELNDSVSPKIRDEAAELLILLDPKERP